MGKLGALLTACLLAPLALANPHQLHASPKAVEPRVVEVIRNGGHVSRRDSWPLEARAPGAPMVRRNGLAARTETKSLSLEQSLLDQPLFSTDNIPGFPGPTIEVVCHRCCSKGSIDATFPSDFTDILNPKFRLDLRGVEVSVELDMIVSSEHQFEIPLLTIPPLLTNVEVPGFSAGLFVDLVLVVDLSGKVDVRSGFTLSIPDGAFFEIDIDEDGVYSQDFSGLTSNALPITIVNDNTAIDLKVALQLKARIGVTAGTNDIVPGPKEVEVPFELSAGIEVGAYINLVEYVAKLAPTDECVLDLNHEVNINVGAFAKAGFEIGDELIGIDPTVTTTLFALPLPTLCVLKRDQPVPKRKASLPKDGQCAAPPPLGGPTRKRDGNEQEQEQEGDQEEEQQVGDVVTHTTVLCASGGKDCEEAEMTTLVYSQTVCPPVATNTGGCFADVVEVEAFITTEEAKPTRTPLPTQAQDVDNNVQDGGAASPSETPSTAATLAGGSRLGESVIALAAALAAAMYVL